MDGFDIFVRSSETTLWLQEKDYNTDDYEFLVDVGKKKIDRCSLRCQAGKKIWRLLVESSKVFNLPRLPESTQSDAHRDHANTLSVPNNNLLAAARWSIPSR
jgi:hypothetical protein